MGTDTELPALARVRELVAPIAADLDLDLYDIEQRGATLRITLDTPAGAGSGVTLDALALASRLMSKELDQHDPIPSRYTLEVTSPGVERALRLPSHFQREVGKPIALRLANVEADQRRVQGVIVAADDEAVTIHVDDGDRRIAYADIDRAKAVFEWGGQSKPGKTQKVMVSNSSSDAPADRPGHSAAEAEPARDEEALS
jgi:ribosome maturation factor RimP